MKNIYLGLLGISMYVASACASTPKAPQGSCDAVEDGQYTDLTAVEEVMEEGAVEELADAEEDSAIVAYGSKKSGHKSPEKADEEGAVESRGGGKAAGKSTKQRNITKPKKESRPQKQTKPAK